MVYTAHNDTATKIHAITEHHSSCGLSLQINSQQWFTMAICTHTHTKGNEQSLLLKLPSSNKFCSLQCESKKSPHGPAVSWHFSQTVENF